MYYQNYEDYMRSILGYPIAEQVGNPYQPNYYAETRDGSAMPNTMPQMKKEEIENLYPTIYKTVNPFIKKTCEGCKEPITKELIEKLTEEVYQKIEFNSEVMVKVNVDNNRITSEPSRMIKSANTEPQKPKTEIRNEDRRRPNNSLLQDLIKILILNQLLGGRPSNPPQRPPFPGRPPQRPPYPGGSGRPPYPMSRTEFGIIEDNREYEGYFKF